MKQGQGTYTYSNGDKYEGYWLKDKKHDEQGKFTYWNGKVIYSYWVQDQKSDKVYAKPEGKLLGKKEREPKQKPRTPDKNTMVTRPFSENP